MAKKKPAKAFDKFNKDPALNLFPGPRYEVKREVMSTEALSSEATALAAQLGPDHPKVKMMRKEIADRQRGGRPR